MHFRIVLGHFAALSSRPDHEGVHRPFDVIVGRVHQSGMAGVRAAAAASDRRRRRRCRRFAHGSHCLNTTQLLLLLLEHCGGLVFFWSSDMCHSDIRQKRERKRVKNCVTGRCWIRFLPPSRSNVIYGSARPRTPTLCEWVKDREREKGGDLFSLFMLKEECTTGHKRR